MPMERERYPADWERIATAKKESVGWKCERCGKQCRRPGEPFDTHKNTLTVAHLNHTPEDVRPENLYSDDKTLDRIDGNRGYSPDNCRWATIEQQANNKSNNVWINDNGEKITISQFARKYGLTKACVWGRYQNGWTIEEMKQKSRRA